MTFFYRSYPEKWVIHHFILPYLYPNLSKCLYIPWTSSVLTLATVPNRQREETKRQRSTGIDTVKMGQANSEQALRLLLRSLFLLPRETLSVSTTFQMLPNPTPIQHQTAKTYLNANRVEVTDAEHKYRELSFFLISRPIITTSVSSDA